MRPPSRGLLARFAIASLAVFVVVGVGLHVLISRQARRQAESAAAAHAILASRAVLEDALTPADIASPVRGDRYQELRDTVLSRVLVGDVVRVKVWRPDGTVVFSDETRLIGVRFSEEQAELQGILRNGPKGGLTNLEADENLYERGLADRLLATYVPLHVHGLTKPTAIAEVYQDYAPTAAAAASSLRELDALLVAGFLLLYLVLLPVVRNAGRTLRRQTEDLARRGDELAALLDQRRDLVARLVRAQEEERARMAADIHDDSIQAVTEVVLRLEGVRRRIEDPEALARLDQIDAAVRGALERMRNLLFDLRPPALEESGLAAAFETYLSRAAAAEGFAYRVDDRLSAEPPLETRAIAYRIGQEALANVRKHARASHVDVRLEDADGGLRLVIADDGVGMSSEPPSRPDHFGVLSMRERATVAGGRCDISAAAGQGTTVEVWLPLTQPEPAGRGAS